MGLGLVDQLERIVQPLTAGFLVPGKFEVMIVFQMPRRRRIARRHEGAQAAFRQDVEPAVEGARKIGQGRHPGDQQFTIGDFGRRPPALAIEVKCD